MAEARLMTQGEFIIWFERLLRANHSTVRNFCAATSIPAHIVRAVLSGRRHPPRRLLRQLCVDRITLYSVLLEPEQ